MKEDDGRVRSQGSSFLFLLLLPLPTKRQVEGEAHPYNKMLKVGHLTVGGPRRNRYFNLGRPLSR